MSYKLLLYFILYFARCTGTYIYAERCADNEFFSLSLSLFFSRLSLSQFIYNDNIINIIIKSDPDT